MYQAGIKQIWLYENKGVDYYYYNPSDLTYITNITSTGSIINIENMQLPEMDIKTKMSDSGKMTYEIEMKFFSLGYTIENILIIEQLKSSIYGWSILVEYYDETFKFFPCVIECKDSKISIQKEMAFDISMESKEPASSPFLNYVPGISTVPVYRADTTLITADTIIYTADYAI